MYVVLYVTEFNSQLKELMTILTGLPMVLLSNIATQHTTLCHDDCKQLTTNHHDHMDTLLAQQVCILTIIVIITFCHLIYQEGLD